MTHSDGAGSQTRKPPKNCARAQFWNPYMLRRPKPSDRDSAPGEGQAPPLGMVWYHEHAMGYAVRGERGHRPACTWARPEALVIYQAPTLVAVMPCRKRRISVNWLVKYILFGAYLLDIPLP